ncbi:MAG: FISUMP domain-containing protein [Candidatus Moraniibacteriota bacterium]
MHHLRKKVTDFLNKRASGTASHDMTPNRKKKIVFRSSVIAVLVVAIVLGFQFFDILKLKAASFGWVQNNWSGGASTDVATHTDNQTGWTKFFSKDANVDTSGGQVKLTGTSAVVVDTTDTDFNAGTKTNVATLGTGTGASVTLLKQDGATCSANTECASGGCQTTCVPTCSGSIVSGQFCAFGGLVYGVVTAADEHLWLDRNLGATQVATASDDAAAYGWYFQWGRAADGHQLTTSDTTTTLSATDTVAAPDTAKFIINASGTGDWKTDATRNDTLWTGGTDNGGPNNPCPAGYRVPTQPEWSVLTASEHITDVATALASNLKLPLAGFREGGNGALGYQRSSGEYWSSSVASTRAINLDFYSNVVHSAYFDERAYGFSVRCVKN